MRGIFIWLLVLTAVFIWLGGLLHGLWCMLLAHPELHETRVWFERSVLADVATFAGKASLVGVCVFPVALALFDRTARKEVDCRKLGKILAEEQ